MAVNTKAIKTRIKSVKNTKKITKAMEMVSAAKMRRAVQTALATRPYAELARGLMAHLAEIQNVRYALLTKRPVKNILMVLVTSNRGLCGSFNSNVFKKILATVSDPVNLARHRGPHEEQIEPAGEVAIHLLGVGSRSAVFARRYGYPLAAVFESLSDKRSFEEVVPIARLVMDEFIKGTYDKVVVVYTDYVSGLQHVPKVRQLLPISARDVEKMMQAIGGGYGEAKEVEAYPIEDYVFEPSLETIIEYTLPRLVEIQLFHAVLESAASEHSARMIAMRSASDSAGEMIDELQLSYNKARQATITKELAEIAGGAAALG